MLPRIVLSWVGRIIVARTTKADGMTGLTDWTNADRPYENEWFAVERKGGWHRVVGGGGVIAVPFVAGGRHSDPLIVAVRIPRHATGSISLELPRGGLLNGEEPTCGAARETLEESGWRAAGPPGRRPS